MLSWLSPIHVAHAHGIPFNGVAYLLVISDAKDQPRLRAFTADTSFTPEASAWAALALAPQPLTLTITSAWFDVNEVNLDGGPFLAGSVQFGVQ